jgi:16S rRNA processing protein RimM
MTRPATTAPKTPSPNSARSDDLVAGRLGAPFGIRGEIPCVPTRVGEDALAPGMTLRLDAPVAGRDAVVVRALRRHHGRLLLHFDGVESSDAAAPFAGREVLFSRTDAVLADGEYLDDDLIGLMLVDPAGTELGTVAGVRHFPAQDCLVVGAAFVPLVREFIRSIDLETRRAVVDLPAGLLDPALADEA